MLRGYYMLTSGMLTQQRNLDVIGNNMANASTPGYKRDMMAASTFREAVISRVGNTDKQGATQMGSVSMILSPDEAMTSFAQGIFDSTERNLDFALAGNGFFAVEQADGREVYTRNGSFSVDNEGYLFMQNIGRVLGENGPIYLGTDKIEALANGQIRGEEGQVFGNLRIVDFANYNTLVKTGEGMFLNADPQNLIAKDPSTAVRSQCLERSNVTSMEEMMSMITSQRALQSAGQIVKMYDQIMAKATTEIGRV